MPKEFKVIDVMRKCKRCFKETLHHEHIDGYTCYTCGMWTEKPRQAVDAT